MNETWNVIFDIRWDPETALLQLKMKLLHLAWQLIEKISVATDALVPQVLKTKPTLYCIGLILKSVLAQRTQTSCWSPVSYYKHFLRLRANHQGEVSHVSYPLIIVCVQEYAWLLSRLCTYHLISPIATAFSLMLHTMLLPSLHLVRVMFMVRCIHFLICTCD